MCIYIYIYIDQPIDIIVGVFGPGDLGSVRSRVIPEAQKIVLHAPLLYTQHYKVWIKGKWGNPGKGVTPSPTPQ